MVTLVQALTSSGSAVWEMSHDIDIIYYTGIEMPIFCLYLGW